MDPLKLYEEIDDLVRTRIVCKYMDGPEFVCQELENYCKDADLEFNYREKSTDAGYYAWHFYFRSQVELMLDGEVRAYAMWVEVQLSTQLAEVITSLTHDLYEERREDGADIKNGGWNWDASSQRFRSAYLGHGLHLLEGVIQTFRDDVLKPSDRAATAEAANVEYVTPMETRPDGDMADTSSREDEN